MEKVITLSEELRSEILDFAKEYDSIKPDLFKSVSTWIEKNEIEYLLSYLRVSNCETMAHLTYSDIALMNVSEFLALQKEAVTLNSFYIKRNALFVKLSEFIFLNL